MRSVLLALVAANIVFFVWARWIDTPAPAPVASMRDSSVPPLQLESGPSGSIAPGPDSPGAAAAPAPSAATPSTTAPIAATAPTGASWPVTGAAGAAGTGTASQTTVGAITAGAGSGPAGRCRTLGPFEDANLANAVTDRLRTRGFSPHDRSVETTNPNVYWVYIGELTTDAQRRAIQTLNGAGIHDAASMMQPEQSDRLSVGVFADQAHAVRRAEQVRSLGFKPTLGMRQHTVTTHWIDFELRGGESEPTPAELLGPSNRPGIGLGPPKMADCPGAAGSG